MCFHHIYSGSGLLQTSESVRLSNPTENAQGEEKKIGKLFCWVSEWISYRKGWYAPELPKCRNRTTEPGSGRRMKEPCSGRSQCSTLKYTVSVKDPNTWTHTWKSLSTSNKLLRMGVNDFSCSSSSRSCDFPISVLHWIFGKDFFFWQETVALLRLSSPSVSAFQREKWCV